MKQRVLQTLVVVLCLNLATPAAYAQSIRLATKAELEPWRSRALVRAMVGTTGFDGQA